jgi:hypothetical protein
MSSFASIEDSASFPSSAAASLDDGNQFFGFNTFRCEQRDCDYQRGWRRNPPNHERRGDSDGAGLISSQNQLLVEPPQFVISFSFAKLFSASERVESPYEEFSMGPGNPFETAKNT